MLRDRTKEEQDKILIYGVYAKLLSDGRHYGEIQTTYRVVASTWLLATFAAIGFLLSTHDILPFDHLISASLICLIGTVGIYIIWYEDTVVEELLLDISVIEALRLEREFSWLPRLHHRFLHLYRGNTSIVKSLYFIGCKSLLLFISTISLCFYLYKKSITLTIIVAFVFIIINYLSSRFMKVKASEINDLIKFLEEKNDRTSS